jgi:uncharacterized membrane protein YeaQ/YmgE (transglycosylase-associated protein family)
MRGMYAIGILLWIVFGIAAAFLLRHFFPGPTTTLALTLFFGIMGALVGGMLGVAPYVTHDPSPLRFGGIVGGILGAVLFPFVYLLVARKAL